jgi:hypothetical protein
MKTPREILFARHRQAEPKLDAVRRKALVALQPAGSTELPVRAWFRAAWRELVWPSRRAWAGMAALWLALLGANLGMKAAAPVAPTARSVPVREIARAFEEQRRLLAELLPPNEPPPVQPEVRNPKPEIRKKSEIRSPNGNPRVALASAESVSLRVIHGCRSGFRSSAFFRTSDFGFLI